MAKEWKELELLTKQEKIKWLPWVGENYLKSENKILVIGESHYYKPEENGSFEKHQSPTFTKKVIKEMAIEKDYYSTKVFQNFHKAMMGNDNFNALKFWNQLAYFNFIQKPMNTNKGRPNYDDFYNSWSSYIEIVKILQPKICIFIGTSAADSFNFFAEQNNLDYSKVQSLEKVGANYAKKSSLKIGKLEINNYFIRHTSKYFSWSKWNEYLKKTLPEEIKFLEKISN